MRQFAWSERFYFLGNKKNIIRLSTADSAHSFVSVNKPTEFVDCSEIYVMYFQESGLQQNILYLEAALCFIQSGCAMERHHKVVEAATMFKETHRFVV